MLPYRAADASLFVDSLVLRLLEYRALEDGHLVVDVSAGISVNHALLMQQIFATCKPLIRHTVGAVAKLTLCAKH